MTSRRRSFALPHTSVSRCRSRTPSRRSPRPRTKPWRRLLGRADATRQGRSSSPPRPACRRVLAAALEDRLPDSATCLWDAAQEGRPLASPDVTRDDRFEQPWREQAKSRRLSGAARGACRRPARGGRRSGARLLRRGARVHRRGPRACRAPRRRSARRARTQRAVRSRAHRARACRSSSRARAACSQPSWTRRAVLEEVVQQAPALARGRRLRGPHCSRTTSSSSALRRETGAEEAVGSRASGDARGSRAMSSSRARRSRSRTSAADERLVGGRSVPRLPGMPRFSACRSPARKARLPACSPSMPRKPRQWRRRGSRGVARARGEHVGGARERRALLSASRWRRNAASRSSRTSPTASSRSTARGGSSSGTPPRSRSPACPRRRRSAARPSRSSSASSSPQSGHAAASG